MSLINEVLHDLDNRNAAAKGVSPVSGGTYGPLMVERKTSRAPLWIAALVVLVIAGVLIWQKSRSPGVEQVVAVLKTSPPVVVPSSQPSAKPVAAVSGSDVQKAPALQSSPQKVAATEPSPLSEPLPETNRKEGNKPSPAANKIASLASRQPEEKSSAAGIPLVKPAPAVQQQKHEKQTTEIPVPATSGQAASLKIVNPQQRSVNAYNQAVSKLRQGRIIEAKTLLRQALDDAPLNHDARQLLAGLLIEESHQGEAVFLLQDGLKLDPNQTGFSFVLARLQADAGDRKAGLATLTAGLPMAGNDPQYHVLFATLLQREGRHDEAIEHYLTALRTDPSEPSWLIGIGISLQAAGKLANAAEAYIRAEQTGMLTPELAQFVDQRIKQIKQARQ